MSRFVEILAPAGSVESLKAAICAGADAVYMGGSRFGARAYAGNPDEDQLNQAIDYVHLHGRKIYLTINTLLKDREMEELYEYLLPYYCRGIDGVIVQDVGVLDYIRSQFPGLTLHASTQMTITGAPGGRFLKKKGVERIVPARELSLEEIRRIKESTGLEIECFVHGALCYCYSGQCLFSSMLGGRSGNRGQCAQPCRLPYSVGDGKSQDIMSLKDLCTIDMIPELVEAGIDSFKIEGRMKQPDYVYTVVSLYRKYLDFYTLMSSFTANPPERACVTGCSKEYNQYGRSGYHVSKEDKSKLLDAYRRRGYSEGYYRQHNGRDMISLKRPDKNIQDVEKTSDYKLQEPVNGKLELICGNPSKLTITYKGHEIECQGDTVDKALRQPLLKERAQKQMRKTGNTEFCFDNIDIVCTENIFMPMQSLNELRRKGLDALAEEILKDYRREVPDKMAVSHSIRMEHNADKGLAVSVETKQQLLTALDERAVSLIYVDSSIAFEDSVLRTVKDRDAGNCRIYIAMPYIFRDKAARFMESKYQKIVGCYDGALIRNWESYEWLLEKGFEKTICADYNLYIFNRRAKEFMTDSGISSYTAPVELNSRELKELGIEDCEFIVYGYTPLMVTANCIQKTDGRSCGGTKTLYLKDRYQKKFAVKNYCEYCYNIIYNSSPLVLLNQAEEVVNLHPKRLRLCFTSESETQVKEMLHLYKEAFIRGGDVRMPDMDFTKGHFKRGVK